MHSKLEETAWEVKHVKAQMLEILSGDLGRRKLGVVLLLLGLIVSVSGNILSAVKTSSPVPSSGTKPPAHTSPAKPK
jgi:hypothetical protein